MSAAPRVLVTAVSGGSVGEQVCKALHWGACEYELIVTNTSLLPMKIVPAEHYELLPPANSDEYLLSLRAVLEKYDCGFVIPGSETELLKISNKREDLSDLRAKLLINSDDVISLCLNKLRTAEFLSAHGFRAPATISIDDQHLEELSVNLPCIIKPAVGGGGSAFTFIAQDSEELVFFVRYLRKYGYQPLIQEYVGRATEEYTIGILHDPSGELIGASVMRRNILAGLSRRISVRNLTERGEFGPTLAVSSGISQGEIVRHEPIRRQCEEIAKCLGSRGPLNIQGRWDGEEFVTFEINPRFSGTSSMRAMAGFNEPDLLIQWHLNGPRNIERIEPRGGEFTRGLVEHFTP